MAENILAAACESETRKAAKRMRLEIYQSSQVCAHAGYVEGVSPMGRGHWSSIHLQLGWTERWEGSRHVAYKYSTVVGRKDGERRVTRGAKTKRT